MFCKNCGTQLDNDARFCPKCGTALDPQTTNTPTTPLIQQPPAPVRASTPSNTKNVGKAVAVFLAIIAVALISILLFMQFQKKPFENTSSQSQYVEPTTTSPPTPAPEPEPEPDSEPEPEPKPEPEPEPKPEPESNVEKPTYLTSLTPFYTDYGSTKLTGVVLQDKLGNSYFDCLEYIGGHFDLKKNNISTFKKRDTYVIGGKYSTFSGTVFVPDTRTSFWDTEISDQDKSKGSFALRIYGDDRLLYQSPVMISTQYPVVFELDVSGVEQLSIAWATFSDVTAEIGLADACLYKD